MTCTLPAPSKRTILSPCLASHSHMNVKTTHTVSTVHIQNTEPDLAKLKGFLFVCLFLQATDCLPWKCSAELDKHKGKQNKTKQNKEGGGGGEEENGHLRTEMSGI